MPLVPETKMVDIGKLISLGNLLVRKVTWLVLTTTSATLILSRAFGADRMTRIAYIYSLPRTHYLHCDFQRQHTHTHTHTLSLSLSLSLSFHIFTYRNSTHTHTHTHTHTYSLSLSYILTSSNQPYENVYILQPFSFQFYLFGKTSSSLEHSLKNFVKPQKRQITNRGDGKFLQGHVDIFLYINTLHVILSPHTFYSRQETFNI